MGTATSHARNTTEIRPESLYPLSVFYTVSGISRCRVGDARKLGLELTRVRVGRRQFVEGREAIHFIKRLAEQEAGQYATSV